MSSVASAPAANPAVRPSSSLHLFVNLCRKELAESKTILIAGVAIFWLMPALWAIVWWLVYRYYSDGGFFVMLMGATGWFYAIVVGAHTVCRDWGRPEGLFLQARPVPPRMIVVAKLVAGLVAIGLVMIPATVEGLKITGQYLATGSYWDRSDAFICFSYWSMSIGFFLAFAAAFATRQTLSSILIAALLLALWLAAPLLSSTLSCLHPSVAFEEWARLRTTRPVAAIPLWLMSNSFLVFIATVAVVLAGTVAASFVACARERVVALSYRTLAWVVAVMVLCLFGMAMREIGNSLEVTDQGLILNSSFVGGKRANLVHRGERFFALAKNANFAEEWLAVFEVGCDGRIRNQRADRVSSLVWPEGRMPEFLNPVDGRNTESDVASQGSARYSDVETLRSSFFIQEFSILHIDEAGDLVIAGFWRNRPPDEIHRVTIHWPEGEGGPTAHPPRIIGHQIAQFPVIDLVGELDLRQVGCGVTDKHAYVRFTDYYARQVDAVSPTSQPGGPILDVTTCNDRIYRYDFSPDSRSFDRLQPVAEYKEGSIEFKAIMDSPERAEGSVGGCLPVWEDPGSHRAYLEGADHRWRDPVARFDSIVQMRRNAPSVLCGRGTYFYEDRTGVLVLKDHRLACRSERAGLFVFTDPSLSPDTLVGAYRVSLLGTLERGSTATPVGSSEFDLFAMAGSRVAELDDRTLSLYDFRDPAHPRRIGFLNRFMPCGGVETQVIDLGHHLVFREGGLLTVLANPPAKP